MKRFGILFIMALPMLLQAAPSHEKTYTYHFGYISGSVGYSNLSQNVKNVSTTGDFAYLFGAGYEFRVHSFWLSVGAQFMQERSTTTVGEWNTGERYSGYDNQGKQVTLPYIINQVDAQKFQTIDIPLMMGYYYKGFYVGAGAKVGFSFGSTITTRGTYELLGDYKDKVGIFQDVNFYKTYTQDPTTFDVQLRPQFSILGEVGYDVLSTITTNSSLCNVLKIGFYFEYGLRSVRPSDSLEPLNISTKSATIATINPYYLNTQTDGDHIVPYYVGVKVSYLIGGSREKAGTWHKGCQCYGK